MPVLSTFVLFKHNNNYILFIFEVVKIGLKTILTLSCNTLKTPMNGNKLDQCWSLKDLKLFPL